MGTVSANPRKLELYSIDSENQVRFWKDDIDDLRQALTTLRSAMAASTQVHLDVPTLEDTFEELTANLEHLDGVFVRNVAQGIAEADNLDYQSHWGYRDYPDLTVTADETAFDPGPASRDELLADTGQADAETLMSLLDSLVPEDYDPRLGLVWDSLLDNETSRDQVIALLEAAGPHMDDPAYVAAFYETLGADGTLGLASLLDDLANHNTYTLENPDAARDLIDPLLDGFATYTHWADNNYTDTLLNSIVPAGHHEDQRMHLAILFSGTGGEFGYDPELLAQTAHAVNFLNNGKTQADLPDTLMMRALALNPDAAWYFATHNNGNGDWLLTNSTSFEDDTLGRPDYTSQPTDYWTGLGYDDHETLAQLHNLWAATTWAHSRGITLDQIDPEAWALATDDLTPDDARLMTSLGIGFTPIAGDLQAGVEATTGHDYITGETLTTTDRWIAGLSLALPFIPLNKILKTIRKAGRSPTPHPPNNTNNPLHNNPQPSTPPPRPPRTSGESPDVRVGDLMPGGSALPRQVVEQELRGLLESQTFADNFTVEVIEVKTTEDSVSFGVNIYQDGILAGQAYRVVRRDSAGIITVDNVRMELYDTAQNHGFGTDFNRYMEDWYRDSGVYRVNVHANLDVGGYTWAIQGFNWSRPADANRIITRMQMMAATDPLITDAERRVVEDIIERANRFQFGQPGYPSAREVALIGRGEAPIEPFGKRVLIGEDWMGNKQL